MRFELLKYDMLDSTNVEAVRLYKTGKAVSGMVIVADEQTGGKGHGNNRWESERGKNLTFSVMFKPDFIEPSSQFVITQLISLSIWEVLQSILRKKHVSVKWPNDIYVGDRKISGILIQNFIKGNTIDMSVIGVGLNVSQKLFLSTAPNPTSVILESGMDCPLDNLLEDILETFDQYVKKYNNPALFNKLTKCYLTKLYRFGEQAIYKDAKETFTAAITGVSEYGQLLLTDANGVNRKFGFKEVELIKTLPQVAK
jgi:BirA family biotin operon repressor/biotin-[acetyl-CoA-carboxylase] ligase